MTGFLGSNWSEEIRIRNEAAALNSCRELVEVPSGQDWEIRRLIEKYPDTCWKYAETSTILKYQAEKFEVNEEIIGNSPNCSDYPVFHARLIDVESPFDLSVQPKYLDRARSNLTKTMNEEYSKNSENLKFLEDQLILNIACAVNLKGEWYRSLIEKMTKTDSTYVRLVDNGSLRIVNKTDLRRLMSKFGRIPPMVLRCKVRGIFVQNMNVHKMEGFKSDMAELNNFVRCQVTSNEEPFLINLFHPTIYHLNLCEHLYDSKPLTAPNLPPRPQYESDDEDDYDEDEEEWEDETPQMYIREFPRSQKAMRFSENEFEVVHVEHANLIFLANSEMLEERSNIEEELKSRWSFLPVLPTTWNTVGGACTVLEENNKPKRAAIEYIEKEFVEVVLIDYGRYLKIRKDDVQRIMRAVPEENLFCSSPQVIAVSLKNEIRIHLTAIQKLRSIIPAGCCVHFNHYQKSKKIPIRGDLKINSNSEDHSHDEDVETKLFNELGSSKIDINCLELLPVLPIVTKYQFLLKNSAFIYRYNCPKAFTRANSRVLPLPV